MHLLVGFVFFNVSHCLGAFLAVPFLQKVLYPLGESSDVKDPALLAEVWGGKREFLTIAAQS